MTSYTVRFKGPQREVFTVVSAPDAIFAGMKGMRIAQTMAEKDSLRIGDYAGWQVIVDADGEERYQRPFPVN